MSTKKTFIVKAAMIFIISAAVIFNSTDVFAQGGKGVKYQSYKEKFQKIQDNFKAGLKSDNLGLKKSCIYFIGQYQLQDCSSALAKQLKKEEDPEIRTLIVLSIFKIGEEKGLKIIKDLAENDENEKVRNTCKEICKKFSEIIDSKMAQLNIL